MWKSMLPDARLGKNWEPIELRVLKRQLANLSCECNVCKTGHVLYNNQKDQEIQAEIHLVGSSNRFTQAATVSNLTVGSTPHRPDTLCPSCFLTMNLFKGGGVRVLKDEEIETKSDMFSCDKSVGKVVTYLEKTTSITQYPMLKSEYANKSAYDFTSEISSDISMYVKNDKVRFRDECIHVDKDVEEQNSSIRGTCMCLGTFMETIRPPEPLGQIIHWA